VSDLDPGDVRSWALDGLAMGVLVGALPAASNLLYWAERGHVLVQRWTWPALQGTHPVAAVVVLVGSAVLCAAGAAAMRAGLGRVGPAALLVPLPFGLALGAFLDAALLRRFVDGGCSLSRWVEPVLPGFAPNVVGLLSAAGLFGYALSRVRGRPGVGPIALALALQPLAWVGTDLAVSLSEYGLYVLLQR
jgi:hypothetical protein